MSSSTALERDSCERPMNLASKKIGVVNSFSAMCGMVVALHYARSLGVVVLQDVLEHPRTHKEHVNLSLDHRTRDCSLLSP